MGEAKRRREYWEKQGQIPPQGTGSGQPISSIDKIKRQLKQTLADTERVKHDHEFKRQCQVQHDSSCRSLKEKLANKDSQGLKEAIQAMSSGAKLDETQLRVWSDYMIVSLLSPHKIDEIQAQLFVKELVNKRHLDSNKSHLEYIEEQRQIEVHKAYLKAIERWVYIENPLLSIYQSVAQPPNI